MLMMEKVLNEANYIYSQVPLDNYNEVQTRENLRRMLQRCICW